MKLDGKVPRVAPGLDQTDPEDETMMKGSCVIGLSVYAEL